MCIGNLVRPKNMCALQISRLYLDFCPDPKHFNVNFEEDRVKYAEKRGKLQ